jgi:ribonucleoside-diphosphate reductase alpha chain
MLNVLRMHRAEVSKIDANLVAEELLSAAAAAWDEAVELGELYGVRNSQASVLAPTGTIGLMMDCDTTGIEPDFALVKHKNLVGGGSMAIINQTVPRALQTLGYTKQQIDDIVAYIFDHGNVKGAPHLKDEHADVFACAVGDNAIHYLGHVKMMSAVQPFISGAISKTVNMPEDVTVEDVEQLHIDAWKMGLKAIAIYRDNCKVAQPLSGKKKAEDKQPAQALATAIAEATTAAPAAVAESVNDKIVVKGAVRRMLPRQRRSRTYINVSKQGSTLSGLMDSFAISMSHGLQYGVPVKSYVKTLMSTSFAPAGITDDPDIRTASSITDYIMRRMALDYLSFDDRLELGLASIEDMPDEQTSLLTDDQSVAGRLVEESEKPVVKVEESAAAAVEPMPQVVEQVAPAPAKQTPKQDQSAPLCFNCGNQTQRAGSCYVCTSCGSTTGCS